MSNGLGHSTRNRSRLNYFCCCRVFLATATNVHSRVRIPPFPPPSPPLPKALPKVAHTATNPLPDNSLLPGARYKRTRAFLALGLCMANTRLIFGFRAIFRDGDPSLGNEDTRHVPNRINCPALMQSNTRRMGFCGGCY